MVIHVQVAINREGSTSTLAFCFPKREECESFIRWARKVEGVSVLSQREIKLADAELAIKHCEKEMSS